VTAATVRHAAEPECEALGRALAAAFYDDPIMCWLFPSPRRRPIYAARFFELRARQLLPDEDVYTTDGILGGALWAVPDKWRVTGRAILDLLRAIGPGLGPRLPIALAGLSRIEHRHPEEPHYYLAVLGTVPESQGQGIGSKLLAPVLERCDRDGVGAYLESSKERNIAFYARHGFRVTDVVRMPMGPPVWLMWRDPR